MGNNTSTEEKAGGGFLLGLGTILAFTPIGFATSTWMIPVGGALVSGKEQTTGVGGTYSDDGKGIQFHMGNPNDFIRQREYVVNKEINEKNKTLAQQKSEKDKLNNSIKAFNIDYNSCLEQFKRQTNLYLYYDKMKVFTFSSKKAYNDGKKFDNFADELYSQIGKFYCSNNDQQIDRIYVIRRNLGKLPFHIGWLAHSGLLLRTTKGEHYICEYGVESNKNAVSCYKVNVNNLDMISSERFKYNNKEWSKQFFGTVVQNISVGQVHNTMMDIAWKQNYSMLFWNCHMAQEKTREELGLNVNMSYLNDELGKEMELYNSIIN